MTRRLPSLPPAGRFAARLAIPLTVLSGLVYFSSQYSQSIETPRKPVVPLFTKTERADNPTRLCLQADDMRVAGWISGTTDFAGRKVLVEHGDRRERVTVGRDNTFSWIHNATAPESVTFRLVNGQEVLTESLTVSARKPLGPSVFFVVDRSVYRPTQPLHFAGFVRKLDKQGQFAPVVKETVEVALTSERKGTVATKMKLTTDDFGRITGSYTFSEADALDNYNLTIPGVTGAAKVTLGEYRKSKVKLTIAGAIEQGKLKLKFQAVDFLEKPVPGSKVDFTAQVVHRARPEQTRALKAEEFVYGNAAAGSPFDLDDLPEEERLIFEAEGVMLPFTNAGPAVVAQVEGQIDLQGNVTGEYDVPLQAEWLKGNYAVVVQGVVVDANGREQRATQSIPLRRDQRRVELDLPRRSYAADEPIAVKARLLDEQGKALTGKTTLVAMKLAAVQNSVGGYWEDQHFWSPNGGLRNANIDFAMLARSSAMPRRRWLAVAPAPSLQRSLASAVAFTGDTAALKLSEPGAYKLVAIAHLDDGTKLQNEIGCVVRNGDDPATLVLQLDKDELSAGERLVGAVHSKLADARVLLTVRDAAGIRLTRPLQLKNGLLELNETLPGGLGYGCVVEVQYAAKDTVALASKFVRIAPTDRMLSVQTTVKETCKPGEKVKLDFQVNRAEAVDLVVSVYDQSLLGIAADRSVDIRNFYLADERVRYDMGNDIVRRLVGSVTVEELLQRGEEMLRKTTDAERTADTEAVRQMAARLRNKSHHIGTADLVVLLRLAGVTVQPGYHHFMNYGYNWTSPFAREATLNQPLYEIAAQPSAAGWRLAWQLSGNTVILREASSNGEIMHTWHGGHQGFNQLNQLHQLQQIRGISRSGFSARGDAHHSVSGNSSHSVEGQAFLSHMPTSPSVALINADADQSHIGVRRDFSDSAFWNATLRTNAQGKASVEFTLPDSLTNWQVVVTAISKEMHVGQAKAKFRTFKPIMVWPMLPRTFTVGDSVGVFASVHNQSDLPQTIRVRLKVENGVIIGTEQRSVPVPAKSNVPVYWTFNPGNAGFCQLLMSADCEAGSDASLKRLPVVAVGAEQVVTASGLCKDGVNLTLPKEADLRTAQLDVTFAPSLAADMADTLNYLVDYPYGCVEQTMSKFLPAIKVAQLLKQYQVDHPQLNQKLPGCVAGGIKRLLELQQPDGGWGWHGGSQTHEMMTPYALYGLLQAEKAGYTIPNEQAITRGLARLQQFIQNMGENQTADRIYCMYVYTHRHDLAASDWEFIAQQLQAKKLSDYALALSLEMAVAKAKPELAGKLAKALRERAAREHSWAFWQTAGFSRWGDDRFEITAAAMKALVAHDKDDALIDNVLAFFTATKRGDRWNSTKDTAMILYAMVDYLTKQNYQPASGQAIAVTVNDGPQNLVKFTDGLTKKVTLPADQLKVGGNRLAFTKKQAGGSIMYRAVLRYRVGGAELPAQAHGIEVVRTLYLLDGKGSRKEIKSGDVVPRGSYLESEVRVKSTLGHNMQYVLVEDHKPACGEYLPVTDRRFNQACDAGYALREERTGFIAYHHEQVPPQFVNRSVLLAELSGEYVIPPARAEMMYQTETRGHSGAFKLRVD